MIKCIIVVIGSEFNATLLLDVSSNSLNFTTKFDSYSPPHRLPTLNISLFHPFEGLKSLVGNHFEGWPENIDMYIIQLVSLKYILQLNNFYNSLAIYIYLFLKPF